jgi:NAD(P)-dependent dehydrogenase (short-subunit alcohol dehydrogenase family)
MRNVDEFDRHYPRTEFKGGSGMRVNATTLLAGRTAIITGAAGGIGREIAETFARHGAAVAIFDRTDADAAVEAVRAAGAPEVHAYKVDVSDVEAVRAAIARPFDRLDLLVNNAGVREVADPLEIEPADWRRVIDIDLSGAFWCAQAAARRMRDDGQGSIINIASVAGLRGFRHRPAYCAAKHGIVGLTRQLAADLGPHGIRVNCICPGMVRTDMTAAYAEDPAMTRVVPLGRVGEPADIADTALYLASDLARYVTGVALPVDGGFDAQGVFDTTGAGAYTQPHRVN